MAAIIARSTDRYEGVNTVCPVRKYNERKTRIIKKNNFKMKTLELKQIETIEGGGTPTNNQIMCFVCSVGYGFVNPFLGIFAGAVCLFAD
jgi:hypothetical protein